MAKYRKRPIIVEASQFFYGEKPMPGVFYPSVSPDGRTYIGDAFVITAHGQVTNIQNGDWILPEPDGLHYYPCKDEIFREIYELVEDKGYV